MIMEVSKSFSFSASHILPKHKGKCSRLHGHNWTLIVTIRGEVNKETGFVIDYTELKEIMEPLIQALDHRHLGQWIEKDTILSSDRIPTDERFYDTGHAMSSLGSGISIPIDFYPTSENLLIWIGNYLAKKEEVENIPAWHKLELKETDTVDAVLWRKDFDNG